MNCIGSGIEIEGTVDFVRMVFAAHGCRLVDNAHRVQIEAGASKWGRPGVVDDSVFAVTLGIEGVDASHHV